MTIEHNSTKKRYPISPETWAKLIANGKAEHYTQISAPEIPKEVKNVRRAKAVTTSESDNNGFETTDDRLPGEDVGETE